MKLKLLLLTIPFFCFAQGYDPATLLNCQKQGLLFNDGFNNTKIPKDCDKQLFHRAGLKEKWISPDKSIIAYGYKNVIFVRYDEDKSFDLKKYSPGQKVEKLSGKNPRLEEIHYLKINEKDKEIIAIINPDHALYAYELSSDGNIGPIRYLETPKLKNCNAFGLDHKNQRVIISCPDDLSLKIFRLKAYNIGRKIERNPDMLTKIQGSKTKIEAPDDIVVDDNFIYLLDNKRILVFDLTAKNDIAPKSIFQLKKNYLKLKIIKGELNGLIASGKYEKLTLEK